MGWIIGTVLLLTATIVIAVICFKDVPSTDNVENYKGFEIESVKTIDNYNVNRLSYQVRFNGKLIPNLDMKSYNYRTYRFDTKSQCMLQIDWLIKNLFTKDEW